MSASLRVRLSRRAAAACLVGTAIASVPATASAYCRTVTESLPASYNPVSRGCYNVGKFLYWKNPCVSFSLNQAGSSGVSYDTAKSIIDQAFARWTGATCPDTNAPPGIAASDYGASACDEVRYNKSGANQNLIVFRDTTWPYSDPNNTLGLTTVTFEPSTGEIYDADMELNATQGNLSTSDAVEPNGFDLASVVTHEAGHFFGLAHAQSPTSTMYASYRPGTTQLRTLSADDVEGLCAIYPSTTTRVVTSPAQSSKGDAASTTSIAADQCDYDPRHGFSTECNAPALDVPAESGCRTAPGASPDVLALGACAVGLALVRRRRRA